MHDEVENKNARSKEVGDIAIPQSNKMAQAQRSTWIQARDLQILHGNDGHHWSWDKLRDGEEVATLLIDTVLDIKGIIDPVSVPPPSAAYLVFKVTDTPINIEQVNAHVGFPWIPSKGHTVNLIEDARPRLDGWLEVKLGDVFDDLINVNRGGGLLIEAHLRGKDNVKPKSGLIVRAVEVVPIDLTAN